MTPFLQQSVGISEQPAVIPTPSCRPAIQADAVSVIYTGFDETLQAARVGAELASRMRVPLRVVHFRTVPQQSDLDRPDGLSPVETEAFVNRLCEEAIAARVRVYLCRDELKTIPHAFKPHSLVVIGGYHSWLPTRVERWRHALEDAGHFVVVVDPSEQKEPANA
jgi:hypothetical protein